MAFGIRVPDLNVAGAIDDVNDYVVALVNGALKLVPTSLLGAPGPPPGPPTGDGRLTVTGDFRITEDGNFRTLEA